MLKIERIQTNAPFSNLAKDWNDLLESNDYNSVFLTWEWMFTWWKYYQSERELFLLLIRNDSNQELVGIAPFCINLVKTRLGQKMRCIQFLGAGEPACSEYLDILCFQGYEKDVWQTIVQYLTDIYQQWNCLQLQDMSESSTALAILPNLISHYKYRYHLDKVTKCPYLILTDYNQNKQSTFQSNLLRKKKKLMKQYEVNFRTYDIPEEIEPVFNQFIKIHQRRWYKKQVETSFNNSIFSQFQKEIALQFSNNNWLRIFTLETEDQIIAAIYCFIYRNKTYFYQQGFDAAWQQYSPGGLLMNYAIEESIRNQYKEFDFLRGTEEYKSHWAKNEHNNVTFDIYNQNWFFYTEVLLVNLLRKIKGIIQIPSSTNGSHKNNR
jgi:CelD/BcsL family acetyltransferase involved in cellulose biosynthesis